MVRPPSLHASTDEPSPWARFTTYCWAALVVVGATAVGLVARPHLQLADVIVLYLLGVIVVSTRMGVMPSVLTATLSVLAFDYFFIPPVFGFLIHEVRHAITFAGMLIVAVVVSGLTERLRRERERALHSEHLTRALHELDLELSHERSLPQVVALAGAKLSSLLQADVEIVLHEEGKEPPPSEPTAEAGLPLRGEQRTLRIPLVAAQQVLGVGVIRGFRVGGSRGFRVTSDRSKVAEIMCKQVANAVERCRLLQAASRAEVQVETERIRSAVLSAVSHDLRTPLASISANAQLLLRAHDTMDATTRGELLATVSEETDHLENLLRNLLAMTRVESGAIDLKTKEVPLEDVLSSALRRLRRFLSTRQVAVRFHPDLPLVLADSSLLEQVFINVLENAARYSPPDSTIGVVMQERDGFVTVDVEDCGQGVVPGEEHLVFEKFYRGSNVSSADGGVGLGLAICKAIVKAHRGGIEIRARKGGGTVVSFYVPKAEVTLTHAGIHLPELS